MQKEAYISEAANGLRFDLPGPISASQLLAGRDRVQIEFKGQVYTLSQTRNGKLILTK